MLVALIIDDDPPNIDLIRAYLNVYQVDCIWSTTGQDGYSLALEHQPDVIFTDLLMPTDTWDGYKTIEHLKSDNRTEHIPVIVISAAGDEQRAYNVGCDAFLNRPFKNNILKQTMQQFVQVQGVHFPTLVFLNTSY